MPPRGSAAGVVRLGEIGVADILRAVDHLRPGDLATAVRIARVLGFDVSEEAVPVEDDLSPTPPRTPTETPSRHDDPIASDEQTTPGSGTPPPVDHDEPRSLRFHLRPAVPEIASPAPFAVDPLPLPEDDPGKAPPPLEPLFERVSSPSLLMALLRTSRPGSVVDVPRAVAALARGAVVDESLYTTESSLDRGVQLLVDLSPGMRPFATDRDHLVTEIGRLVPGDRYELLRFAGSPDLVGPGPRRSWRAYQPPPRGRPVVIVTDLGIGRPAGSDPVAPDVWIDFARHAGRESPVTALVPYPPSRWSCFARGEMAIIEWDRSTTLGRVRHALARHGGR